MKICSIKFSVIVSKFFFGFVFLVLWSCQKELHQEGSIEGSELSLIQDGEEDGSFTINKITHGDTPVWLIEDDIERLEKYYEAIESIAAKEVKFQDKPVLNLSLEELFGYFSMVPIEVEGDKRWLKGDGLLLFVKGDEIISYKFDPAINFTKENFAGELNIIDFKEQFPNAYNMRNKTDPYLLNFSPEDSDVVYDYAYLKLDSKEKEAHFRWIDGDLIEVVIE